MGSPPDVYLHATYTIFFFRRRDDPRGVGLGGDAGGAEAGGGEPQGGGHAGQCAEQPLACHLLPRVHAGLEQALPPPQVQGAHRACLRMSTLLDINHSTQPSTYTGHRRAGGRRGGCAQEHHLPRGPGRVGARQQDGRHGPPAQGGAEHQPLAHDARPRHHAAGHGRAGRAPVPRVEAHAPLQGLPGPERQDLCARHGLALRLGARGDARHARLREPGQEHRDQGAGACVADRLRVLGWVGLCVFAARSRVSCTNQKCRTAVPPYPPCR